jgi:hypothetical protein
MTMWQGYQTLRGVVLAQRLEVFEYTQNCLQRLSLRNPADDGLARVEAHAQ